MLSPTPVYKLSIHFCPDFVLNQIAMPSPIASAIAKIKVNNSIFFHFISLYVINLLAK